ncbi:signal peptidase I [Candidatus Saccharibacteria bacterium]|nr:signal peptidase I [Candidatus Saccharibacteria bacterium]
MTIWLAAGISVAALAVTAKVFGLELGRQREQSVIVAMVVVICAVWLALQFLLGIVVGLVLQARPENYILLNLLPMVLVIIVTELMRVSLLRKSGKSKVMMVVVTLLATLIGGLPLLAVMSLANNLRVAQFVFIGLLPWVFSSIFMTFLAGKGGWQATTAYRVMTVLPLMFLPIYPNLSDFMMSSAHLFIPVVCYFLLYKLTLERDEPRKHRQSSKAWRIVGAGALASVAILVVMLFSGGFRFYPLAVATGSMAPNINVGDFIIVEKLNSGQIASLVEGDVLVFSKRERMVVHRIVAIEEDGSGQLEFTTQGDANSSPDAWVVREDEVIGTTRLKLPLVGHPTLWVSGVTQGGM